MIPAAQTGGKFINGSSETGTSSRLGEGMGYFEFTATIATALGLVIAMSLINRNGYNVLFILRTFVVVFSLLLSLLICYNKPEPNPVGTKNNIIEKAAIVPGLTIFFVSLTLGAIVSFIALYANQQGIKNIGPFFLLICSCFDGIKASFGTNLRQKRLLFCDNSRNHSDIGWIDDIVFHSIFINVSCIRFYLWFWSSTTCFAGNVSARCAACSTWSRKCHLFSGV